MELDGNPFAAIASSEQAEAAWCTAFVQRLQGEWANLTPGTLLLMAQEVRRDHRYAAEPGAQAADRWLARPRKGASLC